MKAIRLFDWEDEAHEHLLHEVAVLKADDMTRNGKDRIFVWSDGDEHFNFMLYPEFGTAYPEFDNRVQQQRYARRYRYEVVE
ncbi:hypothetical protein JW859_12385 [bacterium]|nr:hypothetical protein [bacterium]